MAQRKLRKSKGASEQDGQEEEPKKDAFEKSDPLITFKAGDEEQKTTTTMNTLDYDYMNEEYDLIYNPLKIQGNKEVEEEVEVEIQYYNKVGKNDIIGVVNIDVQWIKNFEKEQQLNAEQEEELRKQKEREFKAKQEDVEKIAEEKRRFAEEERIRKEALDALYIKGVVKCT
ncbi:MAG: hypothetical protein EZS28_010434 [Streblomastix strix]|uniref:C2 domain-containing protein n=1 Tax=Streblomastix strix TaxID=222440 RepID=A0A5J4WGH6_9EUKA|nr:MAG: hypothetical protein EZS28_010434 [Streblomastix strix]